MSERPHLYVVHEHPPCRVERESFTFIRITDTRDGFDEVFIARDGEVELASNLETVRALEHWVGLINDKIELRYPQEFPGGMK